MIQNFHGPEPRSSISNMVVLEDDKEKDNDKKKRKTTKNLKTRSTSEAIAILDDSSDKFAALAALVLRKITQNKNSDWGK